MQAEDLFLLGRGLLRGGQRSPGLDALCAAHDADPDHAETLDALLASGTERSNLLEAERLAQRLAQQPGWRAQGLLALGRIKYALLDPAAAAAALAQALKSESSLRSSTAEVRDARRLLARCLLASAEAAQARSQIEELLKSGPDTDASWLLSRALLMEGKTEEASAALKASGQSGDQDPMRRSPLRSSEPLGARPATRKNTSRSRTATTRELSA